MTELTRGFADFVRPQEIAIANDLTVSNVVSTKNVQQANLLFATGTASSNGNNQLIAAPVTSGQQIKIVSLQIQNESSIETTAIVYFGAVAKWRFLAKERGAGFVITPHPSYIWNVGANTALVLNLSGANSFGYNIIYFVE